MTEYVSVGSPVNFQEERITIAKKGFAYKFIDGQEKLVSFPPCILSPQKFSHMEPQIRPWTFLALMSTKGLRLYLEPQEEGGFVAYSKEYPGAIGQGETQEQALKDLTEAISLLKEVQEEDKSTKTYR